MARRLMKNSRHGLLPQLAPEDQAGVLLANRIGLGVVLSFIS